MTGPRGGASRPGVPSSVVPTAVRSVLRSPLLRYVVARLALIPVGLLLVVTLAFLLGNVVNTDPVGAALGSFATPEQRAAMEAEFGLDQPLLTQYLDYIGSVVRGDLGESLYTGRSVAAEMMARLPRTLVLVIPAWICALVLGTAMGSVGAISRGGWIDRFLNVMVSVQQAFPSFVLALIGGLVLSFQLGILPAPVGQLDISSTMPPHVTGAAVIDAALAGQWSTFWDAAAHLVLPVGALATVYSVPFARLSRASVADSLQSNFHEFQVANGQSKTKTNLLTIRASLTPVLTYGAIALAGIIGAGAVIETVVSWGGVSQWAIAATLERDMFVAQGFVILTGTVTFLVYLLGDVAIHILDPRTRT